MRDLRLMSGVLRASHFADSAFSVKFIQAVCVQLKTCVSNLAEITNLKKRQDTSGSTVHFPRIAFLSYFLSDVNIHMLAFMFGPHAFVVKSISFNLAVHHLNWNHYMKLKQKNKCEKRFLHSKSQTCFSSQNRLQREHLNSKRWCVQSSLVRPFSLFYHLLELSRTLTRMFSSKHGAFKTCSVAWPKLW